MPRNSKYLVLFIALLSGSLFGKGSIVSPWKPEGLEISLDGLTPDLSKTESPFFITEKTSLEAAALLKAIDAHYDEDTPRLVYADWLHEHGEEEAAEFIRLQCAVASVPRPKEFRQKLERSRQLLDCHVANWFAPLQNRVAELYPVMEAFAWWQPGYEVRLDITLWRGFIWGVNHCSHLSGDDQEMSERLYALGYEKGNLIPGPRGLQVSPLVRDGALLSSILKHDIHRRRTALSIATEHPEFLENPDLLKKVSLGARELHLYDMGDLHNLPQLIDALTDHDEYRDLEVLRFSVLDILGQPHSSDIHWVRRLARAQWPHLRRLELSGIGVQDTALTPLFSSQRFPALRVLDLVSNSLRDRALEGLSGANFPELVQLDLSGNAFSTKALGKLADTALLRKLHYFDAHRSTSQPLVSEPIHTGEKRSHRGKACDVLMSMAAVAYL